MLFYEPGTGYRILGELYVVGADDLKHLDEIESVGVVGNFREQVEIENGVNAVTAQAYFKSRHLASSVHTGYLRSYEDRRFIVHASRRMRKSKTPTFASLTACWMIWTKYREPKTAPKVGN